jgi:hypothetical protein
VLLASGVTFNEIGVEVLELKLPSPAYCAVSS